MDSIIQTITEFNDISVALRLVLALVMGGLIGVERGMHGRAAGMRTHVLVCLGACMTALVGAYVSKTINPDEDVTRIAAQVISGIGFLGAGTILIRNQAIITGLTTAAGVWCTATIGIALGYGFYLGALIATIITIVTATLLTRLESDKKKQMRVYLELKDANLLTPTMDAIQQLYPSAKHPDISAPKSGVINAVGVSLDMNIAKAEQENCLKTLSDMDNVLFAIEE